MVRSTTGPGQRGATTGRSRGQLCHSAPLIHPQGATQVLGFVSWIVPHQVTGRSATGRGFYWATMNDTDPPQRMTDTHPKATPVTPALVTAQRTRLLQSEPPASTSADPLQSDEFIYTGPW